MGFAGGERRYPADCWKEAMKIRDVMSRNAKLMHPEATLRQAAKLMKECDRGILPVMSRAKRLVGIVSLSELARKERESAKALHGIARPSSPHDQSRAAA